MSILQLKKSDKTKHKTKHKTSKLTSDTTSSAPDTPETCGSTAAVNIDPTEALKRYTEQRDQDPYIESKMQVSFSYLKSIHHFKGFIIVAADDREALKQALATAERELGTDADPAALFKRAEQLKSKTVAVPLNKFKRSLSRVCEIVAKTPQYFGRGAANSEFTDIYREAVAAIKECQEYLRTHPVQCIDVNFKGSDIPVTNVKDFYLIFGKDWKTEMPESLHKILGV